MRRTLQYDLLTRGLTLDRLGTEAFTWYDLIVMVEQLQQIPDSALATELHGQRWSIENQLLAQISDTVAIANWQRAGRKSAPKPKPIPRPWLKTKAQTLGSGAIRVDKFDDWWNTKGAEVQSRRSATQPPTSP